MPKSPKPTNAAAHKVDQAQDRFIATWGQMGSAWGISRTMAEVHALLYITGDALCTDDVMARLKISRGNASMSLRALLDWGIITRVHKRGDRKEYFVAEADVWTMFKTIARERKKREIDPVIASLYEVRDLTGVNNKPVTQRDHDAINDEDPIVRHNARLDAMLDFIETLDTLSRTIVDPEGTGLKRAMTALSKA